MNQPQLFIAIPAYEESEALTRTLTFFRERTALPHLVRPFVAKQGVVANKNVLLEEARLSAASYIAMADDDVEPMVDWDRQLIDGMEQAAKLTGRHVGQTAPRMLLPDGKLFSLWANVHLSREVDACWVRPVKYNQPDDERYHAKLFVAAVPGTLSIFSRDVLDAMNWRFDDRYERSQYDDVDQSLACRQLGFEVLYNGNVSIIHHTIQAAPRAAEENYQKLRTKWSMHPELTRVIEPHPDDIRDASREAAGLPISIPMKARRHLRQLRRWITRR